MSKITVFFGALLVLVSAVAYATTSHYFHTFIPGIFGLLLILFGSLANTEDTKKRMLWMHIAVTVGLLGFLGTIPGFIGLAQMAAGHAVARANAAKVQAAMGTICFVFVVLCVRSFIAARRARTA